MAEQASPLGTFYKKGWENYQQAFVKTIASLTSKQLALPVAPQYVSVGGLLAHMLDARIGWFHQWMGEGDPDLLQWHDDEQAEPEAAELVALFERTWHIIADALDRWTFADLGQLISPPASHQEWLRSRGEEEEPAHTRQWIVWHVMEHEIYHGGELSLSLGTYGVKSFYTW